MTEGPIMFISTTGNDTSSPRRSEETKPTMSPAELTTESQILTTGIETSTFKYDSGNQFLCLLFISYDMMDQMSVQIVLVTHKCCSCIINT